DDHPSRGHYLARFGADRGDDPRGVRLELGEGKLVLSEHELRLRRLDLGLRRLERLACLVELGLRGGSARGERLFAAEVVAGVGRLPLRGREIRARGTQGVLLVLRLEPGDQLTGSNPIAVVDAPFDHAARDTERERGLVLRADGAGESDRNTRVALLD